MEAKLIKVLEHYHLYDGDKAIATTIVGNPMLLPNLSLKNCEAIERDYDLDEIIEQTKLTLEDSRISSYDSFRIGMETILEILGDKKFSEVDVILIAEYIRVASQSTPNVRTKDLFDEYQSLQQNEWDVEIITEPMNLDEIREQGKGFLNSNTNKPKVDEKGKLILKRK